VTDCLRFSRNLFPGKTGRELSVKLGVSLLQKKDYLEAKKVFEEVLMEEPTNVSVLNNLAYIAGELNEEARAIEFLRTALQINDQCAECSNNLGNLLFKQGKIEEARKLFAKATTISPNYLDAHLNLAVLSEDQSDWSTAAASYKEALSRTTDPDLKKIISQRVLWMTEISQNTARALAGEKIGDKK
jgi:Tfp pilus assembly protein PilF